MFYALAVTLAWGAAIGYLRGPHWALVIGAFVAAALCLWFEREALLRSAPANRLNRNLLLAAAYAFLWMIALGLSGVAYALAAWLHR
jgi:hypothetical protein